MAAYKCKFCHGVLEVGEEGVVVCPHCSVKQTVAKGMSESVVEMLESADKLRAEGKFDEAMEIYGGLVANNKDAEIYWLKVLCYYGVVYEELDGKYVVKLTRNKENSIYANADYNSAIQLADSERFEKYMSEAGEIDALQKGEAVNAAPVENKVTESEAVSESGGATASTLLNRAYSFLEEGEWKKADECCEKALDMDFENPYAYLGKLLSELKIKNMDALAQSKVIFDNKPNYIKALQYADSDLRDKLSDVALSVRVRLQEGIYNRAENLYRTTNIKNIEAARGLFESISGYEDSEQYVARCTRRIEDVKAGNLRKIKMLIFAAVTGVVVFVGAIILLVGMLFVKPMLDYNSAVELMEEGEYNQAIDKFSELGDYRDSFDMITECKYLRAVDCMEDGKYEQAYNYFSVNYYRDSQDLAIETKYRWGKYCLENGFYVEAIGHFEDAGYYEDAKELIKETKYGYVKKNFNNSNETTYEFLLDLKNDRYMDSASLYEELYAWRITLVAANTDPDDEETIKDPIPKNNSYLHLLFRFEGGTPGEKIEIGHTLVRPNGIVNVSDWYWENVSDGDIRGFHWDEGTFLTTGTMTVKFYEKGNSSKILDTVTVKCG